MPSILDTIVDQKKQEIALLPRETVDPHCLRGLIAERGGIRDFQDALVHPARGDVALIAEVKKASPSAGVIRPDFNPDQIASVYEKSGASCLSVLTDERFFQGSLNYLKSIRERVRLPLLRKDFIIDERQIAEAVKWGADAVLLIVAILDDARLTDFLQLSVEGGISALVEVHDEKELDRAMDAGATLLGINNRNLNDFTVDLKTTERLTRILHDSTRATGTLIVAESGIHHREDVLQVKRAGAHAVLVGESLMRHPDIDEQVKRLLGL